MLQLKKKISESEKGKKVSNETKQKLSIKIRNYYKNNGTTENMKRHYKKIIRPVQCIETGKIYYGQKEIKEDGYHPGSIWNVCNKKQYTSSGLHWKFYKGDM